jgi:hypothetical protein
MGVIARFFTTFHTIFILPKRKEKQQKTRYISGFGGEAGI